MTMSSDLPCICWITQTSQLLRCHWSIPMVFVPLWLLRLESIVPPHVPASLQACLLSDIPVSPHIRGCPPPHRTGMRYSRNRGVTETKVQAASQSKFSDFPLDKSEIWRGTDSSWRLFMSKREKEKSDKHNYKQKRFDAMETRPYLESRPVCFAPNVAV